MTTIFSVLYGEPKVVKCFLHHLFSYTNLKEVKIVLCYSKSPKYEDMTTFLQKFEDRGLVELVVRKNDDNVRGSDNHKNAIVQCARKFEGERVVILDCDTFVLSHNWLAKLLKEAHNYKLCGIKQVRRGYVHPSFMVANRGFLMAHLGKVVNAPGDTLEFLSGITESKRFLETAGYLENGEDNPLGEIILIDDVEIAEHIGARSRWTKEGVDGYGPGSMVMIRDYYDDAYGNKVIGLIPSFGEFHHSIIEVMNSFRQILAVECSDEEYNSTSKAFLMNAGFWNTYADYYVFQDRDIPVTPEWHEELEKFMASGGKVAIGQSGVYYGNTFEPSPPGGSVIVEHDFFLDVGGFDHNMDGVGLEDREFLLRCEKALGEPVPRFNVKLNHIEHPRRLSYDSYKERIRQPVINGTLNMAGRHEFIWQMIGENLIEEKCTHKF